MKLKDLSKPLQVASARRAEWTEQSTLEVLQRLSATVPGLEITWETGDESWASLTLGEDLAGILRVDMPMAFALSKPSTAKTTEVLERRGVVVVQARTWSEREFCLGETTLFDHFGSPLNYGTDVIDLRSFSLEDLWYVTLHTQ